MPPSDSHPCAVPAAANRPSIAVLPFAVADGSGEHHLSDGVTDDIIVELSRFRDIHVIGRDSSFQCDPYAHDV